MKWVRHAFGVGPNASGWALYWLGGMLPATYRIWQRAVLFFESIRLKALDNWEYIQMDNHWDIFNNLTDRGRLVRDGSSTHQQLRVFWIAGLYSIAHSGRPHSGLD